jgi:hypothetical protein
MAQADDSNSTDARPAPTTPVPTISVDEWVEMLILPFKNDVHDIRDYIYDMLRRGEVPLFNNGTHIHRTCFDQGMIIVVAVGYRDNGKPHVEIRGASTGIGMRGWDYTNPAACRIGRDLAIARLPAKPAVQAMSETGTDEPRGPGRPAGECPSIDYACEILRGTYPPDGIRPDGTLKKNIKADADAYVARTNAMIKESRRRLKKSSAWALRQACKVLEDNAAD